MVYQEFSIHKYLNKSFSKNDQNFFLYKMALVRGQPVKGSHSRSNGLCYFKNHGEDNALSLCIWNGSLKIINPILFLMPLLYQACLDNVR